jgi:polysaccharide biosynthesis/export protein
MRVLPTLWRQCLFEENVSEKRGGWVAFGPRCCFRARCVSDAVPVVSKAMGAVQSMLRVRPKLLAHTLSVALLALAGCASPGPYTWVDDYKDPPALSDKGTILAIGDSITIRVYNMPEMSTKTRVRNDGKVSMPFLNDVDAAGFTPAALAQKLQTRLKEYFTAPVVSISLDDPRPYTIPVTGEVAKPGVFSLEPGSGLLAALASAGGLSPFATLDRIFVIRQLPAAARIRFSYRELQNGDRKSIQFELRQGDAVLVE